MTKNKPAEASRLKRILFVCTGNTCRSPMAESIFKQRLREKEVKNIRCASAGIYAEEGEPMSANAKKAMKTLGIRCRSAKAKTATPAMMKKYNLILCMTASHKEALSASEHKNLFTLAEYTNTSDISDPFGRSEEEYIVTAKQIEMAVEILLETIL